MQALPYPPLKALHILPPWLTYIAALTLAYFAYELYKRYLREWFARLASRIRKRLSSPEKTDNTDRAGTPVINIEKEIQKIRREYNHQHAYREGLFRLSQSMKTHISLRSHIRAEEMTAGEIGKAFSGKEPALFFKQLEEALFQETPPKKAEFTSLCDYAQKTAQVRLRAIKRNTGEKK